MVSLPRRSIGLLLIESSALTSPLVDDDHVVDGCGWLAYEVRKWLPGGEMIVAFPPERELAPRASRLQARLQYVGVTTVSKESLDATPRRTRMLWHVHADLSSRAEDFRFSVRPDRVEKIVVPLGEVAAWEDIAARIVRYAALMAFPETPDEPVQMIADEEPF